MHLGFLLLRVNAESALAVEQDVSALGSRAPGGSSRVIKMANLGDPASLLLTKSATSLKQDLKSVLRSQNKHPEIFIVMLLLKVLNVLYLK